MLLIRNKSSFSLTIHLKKFEMVKNGSCVIGKGSRPSKALQVARSTTTATRGDAYALAALYDLSLHSSGELVKLPGIASRQCIPAKFFELTLSELKQRGFVVSRRGSKGGYRLARPAREITVGEVLTCLGERKPRKGEGGLTELWTRLESSVWETLDHATFADLPARPRLYSGD
jgi:Rrf2 family cysteine metabolism transcriptional repressor